MDKFTENKQGNLFLKYFSPKITVQLNNDSVSFISSKRTIQLGSYFFLKKRRDKYEIVSVGEVPTDNIHSEKVDLFRSDSRSDKFECLIAFMKHGLSTVTSKFALVRPTIICKGVENMNPLLNGYEEGLFRRIFEEAGAVDVYFD